MATHDVTVLMPMYNRLKYFEHYMAEGLYKGLPLQCVCDGSEPAFVARLEELARQHGSMTVHRYEVNRGLAGANAVGVHTAPTTACLFCDDDDFLVDADPFLDAARERLNDDAVLFVSMPFIYAFDEHLRVSLQYDRRPFHGKTGLEMLTLMVRSGELRAFNAGTLYRTAELREVTPEDFFRVSEDYVRIARLCARHPERRVEVLPTGSYMRLMNTESLSSKGGYGLDKIVMHLVSMCVGAYYLMEQGHLARADFSNILLERGRVLQGSYGKGRDAAAVIAALIRGDAAPPPGMEAEQARAFLELRSEDLPPEYSELTATVVPTSPFMTPESYAV